MRDCLIDGDGCIQCDYVIKTTAESWVECGRFGCDYKWNAYDSERGIKNNNKLQKHRKLLFLSDSFCLYFQMFDVIPSLHLCRFLFFFLLLCSVFSRALCFMSLFSYLFFSLSLSLTLIYCLSCSCALSLACSLALSLLFTCSLAPFRTKTHTQKPPQSQA